MWCFVSTGTDDDDDDDDKTVQQYINKLVNLRLNIRLTYECCDVIKYALVWVFCMGQMIIKSHSHLTIQCFEYLHLT